MGFLLSKRNVSHYLADRGIHSSAMQPTDIQARPCKNFNLSVHFPQGIEFLVKQECHDATGKTKGEVGQEWLMHQFLEAFPELSSLRSILPETLDFDAEHSILVSKFFGGFCDLTDFYETTNTFSPAIAQTLALALATLHRTTFQVTAYRDFLVQHGGSALVKPPQFTRGLERLKPEVFGILCADALDFYRLYQRAVPLREAIAHLSWYPCCLIHQDLKLNNVILQQSWAESLSNSTVPISQLQNQLQGQLRLVDWERFSWGDPAYDLATVLANYLKIWLSSLIVGREVEINTALQLAGTPLEMLRPTLVALVQTYFRCFPEILGVDEGFGDRTLQMTGLCLLQRIQAKLEYREPFGNAAICMMQVAQGLLCDTRGARLSVFGVGDF
ncbi:MAG: aminoglycoside phosphotransferase family protein [Oculatellaceae cyanobacterium Prado106]|jgi:hypothetical protein|nr:aminoglycoside phosphotransferase family protein [Oculatellaceae cyanobacterium Prado106]